MCVFVWKEGPFSLSLLCTQEEYFTPRLTGYISLDYRPEEESKGNWQAFHISHNHFKKTLQSKEEEKRQTDKVDRQLDALDSAKLTIKSFGCSSSIKNRSQWEENAVTRIRKKREKSKSKVDKMTKVGKKKLDKNLTDKKAMFGNQSHTHFQTNKILIHIPN